MKIVTSKEMAALEAKAFRSGHSEAAFMDKAGEGVAFIVGEYLESHGLQPHILLLCGKGNNAGDAYVAGIQLLELEYEVTAIQVVPIQETSSLCQQHYHTFMKEGGKIWDGSYPVEHLFFGDVGIMVDGLFGTGFRGTVQEPFASIIELANRSRKPIISIDIPSGLSGETGAVEGEVIAAAETAFLGLPKVGFFLREGWDCVGKLRHVDFGLPQQLIDESKPNLMMLTPEFLQPLMPKIRRSRHKYQAGYVVGLAGSPLLPGAAILSASAALRSGAGIVRLLYPEGMREEFAGSLPELILTPYAPDGSAEVLAHLNRATAAFIGPGLSTTPSVRAMLRTVLPLLEVPCVIDADALTVLAEEDIALPRHTILTPHHGELARLLHIPKFEEITSELITLCQQYADKHHVTLILKGGPTFVFHPNKTIVINPTGDPGMATAGSGDVLTGLIASLLAQGMPTSHAAMVGVFVHGLAGEHAALDYTSYCMTASDITSYFPEALLFTMP
jgi:hydroxyethylthiazole kinase-like uncharacterized protein yjeF